ncbi:MAG: hypothetical protein ACLSD3_13975, partial [Acutalibacteraceae bacterium]
MKKASKTLAVLLSVLLLFSFGTTVFADETSAPDFDAASSSTESSAEPSAEPSATPETSEVSAPESAEPETSGTESSATESAEEENSETESMKEESSASSAENSLPVILADNSEIIENDSATVTVDGVGYVSMQAAIDAVAASESKSGTITLLGDVPNAEGVKVPSGLNLTIDFAGFTYTLAGPGAGSTNTETNGFQLLKDSTILFKNGTVNIAQNATNIKRMVQNYANLTLEDMRFETKNQVGGENYALSFNNGDIVFKGNTSIITSSDNIVAFDVCKFSSYPGGSVTFDNSYTGKINGRIVYDSPSAADWSLAINGNGSFGGIDLSTSASTTPNITVSGGTFASDVSDYVEDGYASTGADGSFTIKPATEPTDDSAAEVGGVYYKSVQNAINAADDGATVTLYKSVSEDIVIDEKSVVLDLNGFTLTNVENDTITVKISANLTVTGSGTVDNKSNAKAAVFNEGTVVLNGGIFDRTSETGSSADVSGGNSWYTLCNHGTMTIGSDVTVKNTGSFSSMIENGYQNYGSGNARTGHIVGTNAANPSLVIKGGTFVGGLNTVKNDDGGKLAIHGGTFSNTTQAAVLNWNIAEITGGTFEVESNKGVILNGKNTSNVAGNEILNQGCLTISGGSFTAPNGVSVIGKMEATTDMSDVSISGGTFSSNVKDFVVKGNTAVEDENGNFVIAADPQTAVAEMNGKGYMSLQEAIAAAGTDAAAVKLLKDIKEDIEIPESANITLEIPENVTLTNASGHTITNNGTLKVTGKGTIDNTTHARGALVNYGTAVLEGTTLTRSGEASTSAAVSGGNSWYVIYNEGEMTITGTTDVVNKGYFSSLICNKGKSAESPASLTVSGGTIEQKNFIAIKNDDFGKLSITGGEISSDDQAVQNWSDAAISGGTLNGDVLTWAYDGGAASKTVISGTAVIDGDVMAINYDNQDTIPTVVIQGGTVNGKLEKATYNNGIVPADPTADSSAIEVSGGSFSEAVDEAFCAEDFHPNKNPDGSFSVHEHTFGSWQVTKPATTTEKGEEQRTCSICSFVESREIPVLDKPVEPSAKPSAAPTTAPTAAPTTAPTTAPTAAPTAAPTTAPTAAPTASTTAAPSAAPTEKPAVNTPQTGDEGVSFVWIAL